MSNTNTRTNPFEKGNQYHKLATHTGRPKRYNTPEELWKAATDYFTWSSTTPVITYRPRRGKLVTVLKNREMSLKELYKWLGICNLYYYKKLPDFTRKVHRIHNVVSHYNFVHAAAGLIKGRSVGHTLRKPYESNKKLVPKPVAADSTIKNVTATLIDPLKKTYVDTRKVRIIKRVRHRISCLSSNHINPGSDKKPPINTGKSIVILRHSKNRIPLPSYYTKDVFHLPGSPSGADQLINVF